MSDALELRMVREEGVNGGRRAVLDPGRLTAGHIGEVAHDRIRGDQVGTFRDDGSKGLQLPSNVLPAVVGIEKDEGRFIRVAQNLDLPKNFRRSRIALDQRDQ